MAATFNELTPRGQVRRLRRLVPLAMAQYDIDVARVRLAAQAFNTTFRVDAFHPRNLLVRHGRVVPTDFQDALWSFVEQELAITLVMLDHRDPGGAAATALRSGYERRRTWPLAAPGVRERLTMARRLQIANLQFNVWRAHTSRFVTDLDRDLRRLLSR